MHLSGDRCRDRGAAIGVVHAALDRGIRLIDTADAYCPDSGPMGHNELLVAEAVRCWDGPADEVIVATKGGHVRDAVGGWLQDAHPDHLLQAAEASRHRLGVDSIDLYHLHRPDPAVPFEASVAALARLVDEGMVRHVGLSNVSVEQLDIAAAIVPIASVQNELSPFHVTSLPELDWCDARDVPFLAWGPLGGAARATRSADDGRDALVAVANERGVSIQQVVLAWLLSLSPRLTVILGVSRETTLIDSLDAVSLDLSGDERRRLTDAFLGNRAGSSVVRQPDDTLGGWRR